MTDPNDVTTEDQILQAVAALIAQIKPDAGWLTSAGALVEIHDGPGELGQDDWWKSFVYPGPDVINAGKGSVAQDKECRITMTVIAETFARLAGDEEIRPYQTASRIKKEHRRALMPQSSRLLLDGVEVGSIRYMGSEPITDLTGAVGISSRVEVFYKEPIAPV